MTRFTAEPTATLVPAVGVSLITLPETTVVLDAMVTTPTLRPAPVSAAEAVDWVSPTTAGAATVGGPVEITRFTGLPLPTLAAAAGLWVITTPLATEALDCEV